MAAARSRGNDWQRINTWLDDLEKAFARRNGGDYLVAVEDPPKGRQMRLHLERFDMNGNRRSRFTHTMSAKEMFLYLDGLNEGLLSR